MAKLGETTSPETREKQRQAALRPEVRERKRQAHLGRKHSPEALQKMRQAQNRPEVQEKRRQRMLGNKHTLGHKRSPEAIEKFRQAMVGRKHSPETKEKMRQARLARLTTRGYMDPSGYRRIGNWGRHEWEHRLIWEQANGPIPEGHVIHHVNGIRDDNCPENLALMTRGEHLKLHLHTPHPYATTLFALPVGAAAVMICCAVSGKIPRSRHRA